MIKIVYFVLLTLWAGIAHIFFIDVTEAPSEIMLGAGVNGYKFAWFTLQLFWCSAGIIMIRFVKRRVLELP